MTTTLSKYFDVDIVPGVSPDTDATKSQTPHWTNSDKIRFVKGKPQKIGGWEKITMNGPPITGCVRTIFSSFISQKLYTLLGADTGLYALLGSSLSNITPLDPSTIAIPNSLSTHYDTLGSDPVSTTIGSDEIIISDSEASLFEAGDNYTLSGSTSVGGVPDGEINTTHMIRRIDDLNNLITLRVTTSATSTTTGGGGSVVRSSGLLTVDDTAHGQTNNDRVSFSLATDTGGILASEINVEHNIRNVQDNTFDILTSGLATSSVSGGGGAATTYLQQIADGECDEGSGQGYGMSFYGNGLYGTALVSDNGLRYPQIWFLDRFGNNIVGTPGNAAEVYTWDGSLLTAPTVIANAPTDVNYSFVSDNILITFGADSIGNRIKASDQNNITQWTSSSTNQVFTDDIEGAGLLRSHVSLNGTNLIFTNNQCYTFRYIGLPLVWEIRFKDNIGIIGPLARVVVKGVAYWMGENNFYQWRGGNVEVISSNTSTESTILNYVFKNINRGQLSKCFAWYNTRYDEIWFHYPSDGSQEVDRVARYHVTNKHWEPDTFDRLAAEYPNINSKFPRLIDSNSDLFRHEIGNDDDTAAMPWTLTTNMRDFGTNNKLQPIIIPDSIQSGDITFTAKSFSYPQSPSAKNTQNLTITPTTSFLPLGVDGRFFEYTFSGEELGQQWIMGKWQESVQQSSRSQ